MRRDQAIYMRRRAELIGEGLRWAITGMIIGVVWVAAVITVDPAWIASVICGPAWLYAVVQEWSRRRALHQLHAPPRDRDRDV